MSRYFLEVLEGWRDTTMLITFAVEAHLDDPAYQDARYTIHPIVRLGQPTSQSAGRGGVDPGASGLNR